MVRENDEFEYGKYYDEDEQQNIFMEMEKRGSN